MTYIKLLEIKKLERSRWKFVIDNPGHCLNFVIWLYTPLDLIKNEFNFSGWEV